MHKKIRIYKNNLILGIIFALAILLMGIKFGFSIKACVVFSILFIVSGQIKFSSSNDIVCFTAIIMISIATVLCTQLALNLSVAEIEFKSLVLNICCVLFLILLIYAISSNLQAASAVGLFVPLFLSSVDYYVYEFRGSEFQPVDLMSIRTAFNVVGSYDFEPAITIFYAWIIAVIIFFTSFSIPNSPAGKQRRRIIAIVADIAVAIVLLFGVQTIETKHWEMQGSIYNGFILNFCAQIKETIIIEPTGYSVDVIRELEQQYNYDEDLENDDAPAIIVIMDESFADLRVLGDLQTDIPVMPFYDSLSDNVIKGYALSSVFGGNTPNSEYEFLTGNSMAFLPSGSIPYQQYIKSETYSLVSYLNSKKYFSIATHPYLSSGWMRTTVYPLLQFDAFYFLEEYPQLNLIREYVSDMEMFQQIIDWYENRGSSGNFFLFGVTMQNHGGYSYEGNDYENTIHLEGYQGSYSDVEQYLSLIHETDAALEYLISYFMNVDEPVVILFYGDHLPKLSESFYEELHGGTFDSLDEQELKYTIPFLIWANYDIEEKEIELTGINYLSTYLMEAAGLQKTAYQNFLTDVQKVIPAINALGYYSLSNQCFMEIEDAEDEEEKTLLEYWQLQYNGMFDSKNRSAVFFPNM